MAVTKKRLELNCILCSQPLTSTQSTLSEDVLHRVTKQNISAKRHTNQNHFDSHEQDEDDQHQVIATKCGHMFHIRCLRGHISSCVQRLGTAPCPICSKPVSLTRLWPVLIPPTPAQVAKMKTLNLMKKQNSQMKMEILEIRKQVKAYEDEFLETEQETERCLADIKIKQKQLDDMNGPTEAELEELRAVHKHRQSIVRVVTKHNADLLGVLMHETNVQMSETDFTVSDKDLEAVNKNLEQKQRDLDKIYEGSSYHPMRRRRNPSRSRSRHIDFKRKDKSRLRRDKF